MWGKRLRDDVGNRHPFFHLPCLMSRFDAVESDFKFGHGHGKMLWYNQVNAS
jgi:hypothetical protein